MFYHLISVSCVNAFALFLHKGKMTRFDFMKNMEQNLIKKKHMKRRLLISNLNNLKTIIIKQYVKEKRTTWKRQTWNGEERQIRNKQKLLLLPLYLESDNSIQMCKMRYTYLPWVLKKMCNSCINKLWFTIKHIIDFRKQIIFNKILL